MNDNALQIEVKANCPACGSYRYLREGQVENVIYRKCMECGKRGSVIRLSSAEVSRVELHQEVAGKKLLDTAKPLKGKQYKRLKRALKQCVLVEALRENP